MNRVEDIIDLSLEARYEPRVVQFKVKLPLIQKLDSDLDRSLSFGISNSYVQELSPLFTLVKRVEIKWGDMATLVKTW